MAEIRKFQSSGMLWNDGEIPVCSFCGKSIDEVDGLQETSCSGQLCCGNEDCRKQLADEACESEVEEITDKQD